MKRTFGPMLFAFLLTLPILVLGIYAGEAESGKAVFLKRCKMCHGADGKGNPALARMLKVEFKSMDSEYVHEKGDAELSNTILKGKGKMAAVRGMSDEDVADVIAYIRSLKDDS